jgi:hypothetical protein
MRFRYYCKFCSKKQVLFEKKSPVELLCVDFLLSTYCFAGEGVSVGVSLTAGAIAGVAEHCVMYPVDSVKVYKKNLERK